MKYYVELVASTSGDECASVSYGNEESTNPEDSKTLYLKHFDKFEHYEEKIRYYIELFTERAKKISGNDDVTLKTSFS